MKRASEMEMEQWQQMLPAKREVCIVEITFVFSMPKAVIMFND